LGTGSGLVPIHLSRTINCRVPTGEQLDRDFSGERMASYDASERPISGAALERAEAAALEYTGRR
jgi:hypothetical protein